MSWYRPRLEASLQLLRATGVDTTARIIDVGGGASTLVDDLIAAGFESTTVLDVAAAALGDARLRLGSAGDEVCWIVADVLSADLAEHAFDLWHDRAAFHFLVADADRAAYASLVRRSLAPGGHLILGMFDTTGPERCSDLPVRRFESEREVTSLFGPELALRASRAELHVTPSGSKQPFRYLWLQSRPHSDP